jgi:thioredoxin 1
MFEQVLNEVTSEYENKIQMYKVNIEDEPSIAQQFGARSIPFMVMISRSGVREPHVGSLDKDTLKYYFEGLLRKK